MLKIPCVRVVANNSVRLARLGGMGIGPRSIPPVKLDP